MCRDTVCSCTVAAVLVTDIVHLGAQVVLPYSHGLPTYIKQHGTQADSVLTVPQVACTRGLLLLEVQHSAEPAFKL
jgi:hypothetical protein